MTPQNMNVEIAEIFDFTIWRDAFGKPIPTNGKISIQVITDNGACIWKPVDYTTDKALCWDLMEMLLQAGWYPQQTSYGRPPEWIAKDGHTVKNESLLLATCAAFLEEFSND